MTKRKSKADRLIEKYDFLSKKGEQEEEAYSRKDYINGIEYTIVGAAAEFFKCRIIDKLGKHYPDRKHWEKEWRYHLGEKLMKDVLRSITFTNKPKALDQVLAETTQQDLENWGRYAANTIAKYLNISESKTQKVLEQSDFNDFIQLLKKRFTEILNRK